jgi:hypothetical protein
MKTLSVKRKKRQTVGVQGTKKWNFDKNYEKSLLLFPNISFIEVFVDIFSNPVQVFFSFGGD